jgi:hypothetical protein
VEVAADGNPEPGHSLDQRAHLRGRRDADRVREDELIGVRRREPLGDLGDAVRVDPSLERTAERHRDRQARADPVFARTRDDLLRRGDALLDRRARIPLREALGRREREADLAETGVP